MVGLANGLAVMRDEESMSLWDHITGECFDGALEGRKLDFWGVNLTNVKAELARDLNSILLKSDYRSFHSSVMRRAGRLLSYNRTGTILAPHFRKSMSDEIDSRLPEGEQGLGLMVGTERGKFYPLKMIDPADGIADEWEGRRVSIKRNELDGVPEAIWVDTGERPMQMLSRWYGFSFTYPNCEIFGQD